MGQRGFLRHIELLRTQVEHWNEHPFSIPAIANLDSVEFSPSLTVFVGESGSGKSTLINAIANKAGFDSNGGSHVLTVAPPPGTAGLADVVHLERGPRREKAGFFLRAETRPAASVEHGATNETGALRHASHGEAFIGVALHQFRANGLYILDEPEAALSPQRQLALMGRMHQLIQAGSQFIIATHSPILMAFPGARVLSFDKGGIEEIRYADSDQFRTARAFLQNPAATLKQIFEQADEDQAD